MNETIKRLVFNILSLPLMICAFASEPVEEMKIEDYPMCDGSRSTESIERLLACKMLDIPYCWYIQKIFTFCIQRIIPFDPNNEYKNGEIEKIYVRTNARGGWSGANMLLSGEADLAFLTCETKELFDSLTVKYGVEITEKNIGMDGIAILVNDDNPVKSLSIDQLQGIFSGEITNWKEVGGNDTIIRLYLPSKGDSGEDVFNEVVMRGKPYAPNVEWFEINELHVDAYRPIDVYDNSITISWSSFYNVSVTIKHCHPVAIDGVEPTLQAVKDGSYPLRAPVKLVTRADDSIAPSTWDVINYALSPDGQQAVEECGYAAVGATALQSAALDRARIQVNGRAVMLDKGGEVVSVRVYSLDGRLARTAQASESGISISGVPAGAYIVAAAFANGESCAQKICCF